ncbi:metal-dependent hydrolase [Aureibacter tunicatorum]|uniref:Membrane-bound metal-dependent hydrolase YbcI (DUF457 family) n=1 Tax=Aureibacter tunicatorum TaxID=866807 RepID=A0AAE3XLM4_9BACT|nr:metal-dependent hydrolase [Aureibacter tunicatorum]MDR6238760.1 membrane-bound metal-dependent hydrolase YbcI (DUF457 family) [Aureibacter tunicatorum]BDD05309.1 hypothetical protein AUTU_27920 [Aureibacter tunicatorum]
MDILSHAFSGIACGTVIASYGKNNWKEKASIILAGGLGGAIPDIDAVSMWSKFDQTIGKALGLTASGKSIYVGKFWYSHHGFTHSILASILFTLFFLAIISFFKKHSIENTRRNSWMALSFLSGMLVHAIEDMPTPWGAWGGVRLFFPNEMYIGGFGNIWWWNNYDLFLIICAVIFINISIISLPIRVQNLKRFACSLTFMLGLAFGARQITTRPVNFNELNKTQNYMQLEKKSKEIQKEILGKKVYNIMHDIDQKIPFYF